MTLTLGTAKITKLQDGSFRLSYMNHSSFLVGEQVYGNINPALRFCRERSLRVIEVVC